MSQSHRYTGIPNDSLDNLEKWDAEESPTEDSSFLPSSALHRKRSATNWLRFLFVGFVSLLFGMGAGYGLRDLIPGGQTAKWTSDAPAQSLKTPLVDQEFEFRPIYGDPPSHESDAAWAAMIPKGRGFVKVEDSGDNDGLYCVSVFHQLHCLNMLRQGYYAAIEAANAGPSGTTSDEGPPSPIPGGGHHSHHHHAHMDTSHMGHCFDYLRQALACGADSSLEKRNATVQGVRGWGTSHQCRDFNALKQWTEEHRYSDSDGISNSE